MNITTPLPLLKTKTSLLTFALTCTLGFSLASPALADHEEKKFNGLYGGIEIGYDFAGADAYGSHYYDAYYDDHYDDLFIEGGTGYYGITLGLRHQTKSGWVVGLEGRTGYGFENSYLHITDDFIDIGNFYWNPQKQSSFDFTLGKTIGENFLVYSRFGHGRQGFEFEDWGIDGNTFLGTVNYKENTKRFGVGIEGKLSRSLSARFDVTNNYINYHDKNTQFTFGLILNF